MQIARSQDAEAEQILTEYVQARKDADSAIRHLEDLEAKLLSFMENKQRKTYKVKWSDGITYTATYTQRSTTQINEQGLRKALTARVFDKFTVKKLDRKALEHAMGEGEVDPMVVAKFAEQVPGRKFLTFRAKEENSGEAEGV